MKLAIIGASYLQLPLVLTAKEMGIETHCFAWDKEAVCKEYADYFYPVSILEKELIFEKCKEIQIDGITTIATDIAMPTVNYVASKLNLIGNSISATSKSTDKYLMRSALSKCSLRSPRFKLIAKDEKFEMENLSFPLIVKPTDRSGSIAVSRVCDEMELQKAVLAARENSLTGQVIIEEYIEGNEISLEYLSYLGEHRLLAITDKVTTGHPHFVELQHHQPSIYNAMQQELDELCVEILKELDVKNGASHIELKIDKDGNPWLIEIGARMGGDFIGSDLVYLSTGFDFVKSVIEVALGTFDFSNYSINKPAFSGVFFLSEESAYLEKYFNEENALDCFVKKEMLKAEKTKLTQSSDRSGYIIYKSNSRLNLN